MLEQILDIRNIEKACKQVASNKGAAAVDGMQTGELRDFLQTGWRLLRTQILEGRYRPCAVRRVAIPKPQGGTRGLGIPTVKDRMIQQAISQQMGVIWETVFSPYSYGFRSGKNAHQAVLQAQAFLNEGKTHVIELDLEKFFDKVNHDKLMSLVSKKVSDKRVLRLIGSYLRSGILEGGLVSIPREGTPQGSPLSPLLSNIMLHELDEELSRRGLSFVRYADDCSIYVSSAKAAVRVMESITAFIEDDLKLKVNREKSKISHPSQSTLLGFSFYKTKGQWRTRIAPHATVRIRQKIKQTFKRSFPQYPKEHFSKFTPVVRGWVNYFRLADCKKHLQSLDSSVRARIRIIYWHKWKRPKTRMRNLLKLSVSKGLAYQWANSSKGSCRIGHSRIMNRTMDNAYLARQGLPSFYNYYQSKEKQLSMF